MDPHPGAIGILSRGVLRIPHLETLIGRPVVPCRPGRAPPGEVTAIVGWGLKPTARRARAYALRHGLPYLALEDGFLRSVGLGHRDPPLALVQDDLGIYYDATRSSRLETLIRERPLDATTRERARRCRMRIVQAGLSKYNQSPDTNLETLLGGDRRRRILVVDQTAGDASIRHGLAGPETFTSMLRAAVLEHPDARILVKTH
ncbi:MAG: capsular polysaccharide biosynthesis protein, partial [Ectothiorhodospira sp.]